MKSLQSMYELSGHQTVWQLLEVLPAAIKNRLAMGLDSRASSIENLRYTNYWELITLLLGFRIYN